MSILASMKRVLADGQTRRRVIVVAVAIGAVKLAFGVAAAFVAWRALGG